MKKRIAAVHEFHSAFGLGIKNSPAAHLGEAKNLLRFNLMKEENEEYLEAANNNDLTERGQMPWAICFIFYAELLLNTGCSIKLNRFRGNPAQ